MATLEAEMVGLSKSASLFEVNVPDYKQLKTCRKEIVLLKELWDMILLVRAFHTTGREAASEGSRQPGGTLET